MRFIVYGVGAVGGVIAGALTLAGQNVIGIARGARLEALRERGMRLRSPGTDRHLRFDCVGEPGEISFAPDDAVLLVMKGQDTQGALAALRAAGVEDQPIFCCQNGVANERTALRYFPNVHGVNVMLPCQYTDPGETVAWCAPNFGNFDIGRFPRGTDAADEALAAALTPGGIGGFPTDRVMDFKHGKLMMNLGNIVEAALGRGADGKAVIQVLEAEAEAVLSAAGIAWENVGPSDPRREAMRAGEVPDVPRLGSSTSQSLFREAGSVETDFLNGEIVLLGRLHGVPTPANLYATRLAARMAREGLQPGDISAEDFATGIGL